MIAFERLRGVPWLASLSDVELKMLVDEAERAIFRPGQTVVAELELGEELFILLEGTAKVTVAASSRGDRRELRTMHAGEACGEISLLARSLRSATVIAETKVLALRLSRGQVERLVARHPSIGVHFAREIAHRIVDTDDFLDEMLAEKKPTPEGGSRLAGQSFAVVPAVGSIRRAWLELVVGGRRELPVLALCAFAVTLVLVRGTAEWLAEAGGGLFGVLRAAYFAGIVLLLVSTAIALMRFRRPVLRWVSVVYGIGFALILNELSVFLAFDIFYLDMTTQDPKLVFSVETLYRRSESVWAVMLMLAFLTQLIFLGNFYRRCALVVRTRLARL